MVHFEIIFSEGSQNTKYALLTLVEFVEIYALLGRTKQTKNLRWDPVVALWIEKVLCTHNLGPKSCIPYVGYQVEQGLRAV